MIWWGPLVSFGWGVAIGVVGTLIVSGVRTWARENRGRHERDEG